MDRIRARVEEQKEEEEEEEEEEGMNSGNLRNLGISTPLLLLFSSILVQNNG